MSSVPGSGTGNHVHASKLLGHSSLSRRGVRGLTHCTSAGLERLAILWSDERPCVVFTERDNVED
jgi:hypothetical protein